MNLADTRPIEILLVEDSPSDAALTIEALKAGKVANHLYIAKDGVEAMEYLLKQGQHKNVTSPDLIMLDLNLPKKSGHEVLEDIKKHPTLKYIPVIILTTSHADKDILRSYELNANCYITKPVDFEHFIDVIKTIENFWLSIVTLPPKL